MDVSSISGFFSYIPIDWIVLFAITALIAFDAVRAGSGRAIALALALPASLFLIVELPHAILLSGISAQFGTPILKSALFGIVFIITYLLVRRITGTYGNGGGAMIQALLTGIATVSVVVVVWLQLPELQSVWHFGSHVQAIFGEQYRFWWIIVSYAVLAFTRG